METAIKDGIAGISDELIEAARCYIIAQAYTKTIRPIVEGAQRKVLTENNYRRDMPGAATDEGTPVYIREPKQTYLMTDDDFTDYRFKVRRITEAAGLITETPDHCPLLVAEHLERQARRLVIKEGIKVLPAPLSSVITEDALSVNYEISKKFVDVTMRYVTQFIKF